MSGGGEGEKKKERRTWRSLQTLVDFGSPPSYHHNTTLSATVETTLPTSLAVSFFCIRRPFAPCPRVRTPSRAIATSPLLVSTLVSTRTSRFSPSFRQGTAAYNECTPSKALRFCSFLSPAFLSSPPSSHRPFIFHAFISRLGVLLFLLADPLYFLLSPPSFSLTVSSYHGNK